MARSRGRAGGIRFLPPLRGTLALLLALLLWARPAIAQGPTMPGTLRYGSGLIDVPVASVLPHMTFTGTFSGFWTDLNRRVLLDERGNEAGFGPGGTEFFADGAVALGLYDRAEVGISIQALGDDDSGGNVWGPFWRVRVLQPIDQGLGLAVGGRYLTAPDFGDGVDRQPGRLGFADRRLRKRFDGAEHEMETQLSLYGVATAFLRGFDGGPLPENDLTLSLGYGSGMFQNGPELPFYGPGGANGWFLGASSHWALGQSTMLTVSAEHNGFDVNVGAQVDVGGLKAGLQYLASNHSSPPGGQISEFRVGKLGVLASLAVCPRARGLRCSPRMMERTEPDTIFLPPPPPDTVLVEGTGVRDPNPGTAANLCLATGENVTVRVTSEGDTLVGPGAVPIRGLRPVLDFAGRYAEGAGWFERGDDIVFEGDRFLKTGDTFPIDCEQILRAGVHQGIPVFTDRAALRPFRVLFIPVRVGLWHRYEFDFSQVRERAMGIPRFSRVQLRAAPGYRVRASDVAQGGSIGSFNSRARP